MVKEFVAYCLLFGQGGPRQPFLKLVRLAYDVLRVITARSETYNHAAKRVVSFVQVRKHLTPHVFEHLEYIGWVGLSQSQKETKSKPYSRIIKLYSKSKYTSKHELISEEQSRVEIEHDL